MKDEIKDLLQYLKNVYESEETSTWLNKLQIKDLLDYITNLQEENERLKEVVENLTTMTANGDRKQIKNTAQYKLEIAQDRIDKAIDKMKDIKYDLDIEPWSIYQVKGNVLFDLLNILQGKSDE